MLCSPPSLRIRSRAVRSQSGDKRKRRNQANPVYSEILFLLVAQKSLLVGGAIILLDKQVHLFFVNPLSFFCGMLQQRNGSNNNVTYYRA